MGFFFVLKIFVEKKGNVRYPNQMSIYEGDFNVTKPLGGWVYMDG